MEKVLIIMNALSGRRKCGHKINYIIRELKKQGLEPSICLTKYSGHATELAKDAKIHNFTKVIAIGGDGTVNEVARGLISSGSEDIPLGIIPTGVGNFLAKEFCIRKKIENALRVILQGEPKELDAFEVKCAENAERLFFGCLGVGLDAEIVKDFTNFRRNKAVSQLSYLKLIMKYSRKTNWQPITLIIDGKEVSEKFCWIICANTVAYGGPITFSPTANHADGLLDIVAISEPMHRKMLKYIFGLSLGKILKNDWATLFRGKSIKILTEKPQSVQVDGDYAGTTPVEITFTNKRIKILSSK